MTNPSHHHESRHDDMPRTLEDVLPTNDISDFQVELAGLPDDVQQDVVDGLTDMSPEEIATVDLDDMIHTAVVVDEKQDLADEHQAMQRSAVEEGDYEAAHDAARAAEHELREAEGTKQVAGWFREDQAEAFEVIETGQDVQALDAAEWHQELGEEHLEAAELATDADVIEGHLDAADEHFDAADAYANSTLHGDDDLDDAYGDDY